MLIPVTATVTVPAVDDPCSDVACPAMEQCVQTGTLAGNCAPVEELIPDAGPLTDPVRASGCKGGGAPGIAGAALLLGLGLASALRRRRA